MSPGTFMDREAVRGRCGYLALKWDDRLRALLRRGMTAGEVAREFGLQIETVIDIQQSMWRKADSKKAAA
jgi:hypothetical protein